MDYYFKIANCIIKISSPFEIFWNKYINKFSCNKTDNIDEYYKLQVVDELKPMGKQIYNDGNQIIFKSDNHEDRLHYFLGWDIPCMMYRELDDKKMIYLNRRFIDSFKREENYCIFNALAFEKVLINHKAIVLHCSYIVVNDYAILFSAPSGTGKSTQANLWKKYKNSTIVNGDRAIIKKIDDVYYAMGTPICGSSDICENISKPLKAIIYLYQSPENHIEKLDQKNMIKKLISETTINFFNPNFLNSAFDIISDISKHISMYDFWCTKDINAIECLEKTLGGKS